MRAGALDGLQQLTRLDLSFNVIGSIEGGALGGLTRLQELNLCHNRITKLNSDVFEGEYASVACDGVRCAVYIVARVAQPPPLLPGAVAIESLDLSQNFLREVPSIAFKEIPKLRHLNMSANLIQVRMQKLLIQ